MSIKSRILDDIDRMLYSFLDKNWEIMPMRFVKLIANYYTDARVRRKYWQRLGVVFGENSYSNLGMKITTDDFQVRLIIGKNVSIAPNVTFVCQSSANNGFKINQFQYVKEKLTKSGVIYIEDEVWLGANVTILPGIRVGTCSVIGAGSVVVDDVEPYSIYAGVPAKKIRSLQNEE